MLHEQALATLCMKIVISLVLLALSAWIISSSKFAPKDKHWAYGIVGTLLGFWFRQ